MKSVIAIAPDHITGRSAVSSSQCFCTRTEVCMIDRDVARSEQLQWSRPKVLLAACGPEFYATQQGCAYLI